MIDFSNMEGQQRGPCGADDGKQNTGSDDRYMTDNDILYTVRQ